MKYASSSCSRSHDSMTRTQAVEVRLQVAGDCRRCTVVLGPQTEARQADRGCVRRILRFGLKSVLAPGGLRRVGPCERNWLLVDAKGQLEAGFPDPLGPPRGVGGRRAPGSPCGPSSPPPPGVALGRLVHQLCHRCGRSHLRLGVASSTSQRRDAHDTNVCSLSGALAVACALVLCGLGAAMFADVLLEFQKLPASDPLKKLAGLVQWIVVGIAGGTVLALAVWFFAAGARDAMREDAGGRGKKGKASQPSPVARTQPQMAGRPDDYVMAATAQMAPATLPPTTAIAQPLPAAASLAAASGTPSTGAVAAAPPQAPAATPTPGVRTMTCVRNYRAVEKDELTLTVGDKVMVITEYLDGWALGRHLPRNGQAGVEGVFPLICMA
ncbi:hypothetical protein DFJ74DRAFT_416015 [Hyaloraphidium curvatum]|nr:hypothetical protein DFJ74DRAFT_416015 [Hyaloraphidium curvatum]